MYKIYNTTRLTNKQRFPVACIAGIIASILLVIAYTIFSSFVRIEFSIAFIGIGWVIGWAIRYFGRGVQLKFSVLGAILTFICIVLSDIVVRFGFAALTTPALYGTIFTLYLQSLLQININSLLGLLFRVVGVYTGFTNSRII